MTYFSGILLTDAKKVAEQRTKFIITYYGYYESAFIKIRSNCECSLALEIDVFVHIVCLSVEKT